MLEPKCIQYKNYQQIILFIYYFIIYLFYFIYLLYLILSLRQGLNYAIQAGMRLTELHLPLLLESWN